MSPRAAFGVVCILGAVAGCGGGAGITDAPLALQGTWRVATMNHNALPFQIAAYGDSVSQCTVTLDSMKYVFWTDTANVGAWRRRVCITLAPPIDTTTTPTAVITSYAYAQGGGFLYMTGAGGTATDTVQTSSVAGTLTLTYLYAGTAGNVYELTR